MVKFFLKNLLETWKKRTSAVRLGRSVNNSQFFSYTVCVVDVFREFTKKIKRVTDGKGNILP